MRRSIEVISILLLSTPLLAAEELLLTGVIAASNGGKAFAVIEQGDGQQRLVSEGESVGNGIVAAINADTKTVLLDLPDGAVLLTLRGSAHPEEYVEEYDVEDYHEHETEALVLDIRVRDGILALSRKAETLNEKQAAAELNSLLGLSSDARIAAFNEGQVETTRQLLQQLGPALAEENKGNHLGSLSIADDKGRRRLYLRFSAP